MTADQVKAWATAQAAHRKTLRNRRGKRPPPQYAPGMNTRTPPERTTMSNSLTCDNCSATVTFDHEDAENWFTLGYLNHQKLHACTRACGIALLEGHFARVDAEVAAAAT